MYFQGEGCIVFQLGSQGGNGAADCGNDKWSWHLTPSLWGAQKNENWRTFYFFCAPHTEGVELTVPLGS
jgi:hypothetical protein